MDFLVHECFWRTTCEKRIRQSFFTNFFPGICSLQIVAYVQWTSCKLHLAPHTVPYGSMNSLTPMLTQHSPLCFILEKRPQSHIIQSSFKRSKGEEEHHHNYEVSSSLWHCWRIRKLTKKNTTIKGWGGIMRKKDAVRKTPSKKGKKYTYWIGSIWKNDETWFTGGDILPLYLYFLPKHRFLQI